MDEIVGLIGWDEVVADLAAEIHKGKHVILTGPKELDLPAEFHNTQPAAIDWQTTRNRVNRMSMRDLTQAIIPALARSDSKPVIAVDDLTSLTPTQMAFWLAIFDHAQVAPPRKRPACALGGMGTALFLPFRYFYLQGGRAVSLKSTVLVPNWYQNSIKLIPCKQPSMPLFRVPDPSVLRVGR